MRNVHWIPPSIYVKWSNKNLTKTLLHLALSSGETWGGCYAVGWVERGMLTFLGLAQKAGSCSPIAQVPWKTTRRLSWEAQCTPPIPLEMHWFWHSSFNHGHFQSFIPQKFHTERFGLVLSSRIPQCWWIQAQRVKVGFCQPTQQILALKFWIATKTPWISIPLEWSTRMHCKEVKFAYFSDYLWVMDFEGTPPVIFETPEHNKQWASGKDV